MTDPGDQGTPDEPYLARPDQPYDEPYLARPDQPYDEPYLAPPSQRYQPPPVQRYQPPPVQPYQPPPKQPYQPPPKQPEKPRRSRRWWIFGAAVIVVVAGATVALILAPTGGSSGSAATGGSSGSAATGGSSGPDRSATGGSSDPDRYGQKVVDVIHELHIPCDDPQGEYEIALCEFPDGTGAAMVATARDKADMDDLVGFVKEDSDFGCTVVVKGYLVWAPDRYSLTHAVGNPAAFAAKHHGHLLGVCN